MLHPNTRIVTCGGTPLNDRASAKIHRAIVAMANKRRPNALLIPTASSDAPDLDSFFDTAYGRGFGCETAVLHLKRTKPAKTAIRNAIRWADIIYVGGGNTLMMMRLWRRLGIDQLLHAAHKRGVVLAGSSAGALCWYSFGHSDSMWYYNPDDWDYIRVRGLGILPATACPHVHGEGRMNAFETMMRRRGGLGIAIDDRAAVFFEGNTYRIMTGGDSEGVFKLFKRDGHFYNVPVPPRKEARPVDELFAR